MKKGRSKSGSRRRSSNSYQQLETRNLLAGVFLDAASGELTVFGDAGDNEGTARIVGSNVRITSDAGVDEFPTSDVSELVFIGFAGNDTYTNSTSIPARMFGHLGNDTLTGGAQDDVIVGGPGDDNLFGLAGNDRLVGANGNDMADAGDGNDQIFGSAGTNELRGGDGNDIIFGGNEVDTIFGDGGIDKIYGLAGDDIIDSGDGGVAGSTGTDEADLVLGLGGNDTMVGGGGLNVFWGGGGDDTMTGGDGENRIHGQAGNDTIVGGPGVDFLRGLADDDSIDGGGGVDFIDLGIGTGDVAIFGSDYDVYSVSSTALGQQATVAEGTTSHNVIGAEFLQFADRQFTSDQRTLATIESFSYDNMNTERVSRNLQIFSHPGDLTEYAENWAADMSRNGFRHSSATDLAALLINGRTSFGENIIFVPDNGQTEEAVAAKMHTDWVNSPVHLANIANADFSELGIGIVKANGGWWGVHVFIG